MLNLYVKSQILAARVREALKREEGQGMVEYGMVIGLVAIAVIVALTALSGQISTLFTNIKNSLPSGTPPAS